MVRLLRSAGFRLALSYALVFGASALLLIAALGASTLHLLQQQLDTAIEADARGLIEQWRGGGLGQLVGIVDRRISGNVDDDALYLVLDPLGRKIAGNLAAWPKEVEDVDRPYEAPLDRNGHFSLARMRRFEGPFGFSLLVGREIESRAALRTLITTTLAWALLLIAILTVGGALIIQNMFSRMLSHVSVTAAAISAGDLSRRVRISGRGDEFDRLAATINGMLDRISRLMDGVRQVSNSIAHDLRTPITRARARLEDAGAHAASPADLRAAIERAVADLDGVTSVFQ